MNRALNDNALLHAALFNLTDSRLWQWIDVLSLGVAIGSVWFLAMAWRAGTLF